MSKKLHIFSTLLLVFLTQITFAQEKTISGIISDEEGLPLPGVNIIAKNTKTGTQTDFDGNYSITANTGAILSYSFIGYKPVEKTVGNSPTISFKMEIDAQAIDEVVINALGVEVKRSDKTAAVSKVKGDAVANSGEVGVIQGLSGKAAGVNITNSSGDPGAGAYIQIRGQSSITRSLQPLFVIDGVPVNNDERRMSETDTGTASTSQQSRANDLNPNDIKSIKVLKGASASALWGSRAANGVILITTKSGSKNAKGKVKVSVFSNVSYDTNLRKMKLQNVFGQGNNGKWKRGYFTSWGDRINSRPGGLDKIDKTKDYFVSESGKTYYPVTTKNSTEDFSNSNYQSVFRRGLYLENGATVSGGNQKGTFFFSLGKLDQQGFIRNSDYVRYNGRFNASINATEKLTFKGNLAYSNVNSNRIQTGSNTSGLLLGLYRTPADFDTRDYIGVYYDKNGTPYNNSHRAYRQPTGTTPTDLTPSYNNPLWTMYRQKNPNEVDRYIASAQFNYEATNWLSIIGIAGIDNYSDIRSSLFPINSVQNAGKGFYEERRINYGSYYTNIFGQIYKELNDDFSTEFTLGCNFTQRKTKALEARYQNFILDTDQITFQNAVAKDATNVIFTEKIRTSAAFSQLNLDYKNILLLNFTGRAENASSFGNNKIFFYPSAGLGFNFSELKGLQNSILSLGKLRLSYGQTGQEPKAYATETYFTGAKGKGSFGPKYDSGGYNGAIVRSLNLGNTNLEPEIKTEYEIGVDLKFLNNRIGLVANHYINKTDGALIYSDTPLSTGFLRQYGNFGNIENKGYEVELNGALIRNDNFSWAMNATWNTYKNIVTNIDGAESLMLGGFTGVSSRAVEGYSLGAIWGISYARDANNNLILDANGFPTAANKEGVLGDPNPDWRGGIGTTFTYKGVRLSGLFDVSIGGDVWDGTSGALTFFGRTPQTANQVTLSAEDAATIVNVNGDTAATAGTAIVNNDGSVTVRGNIQDFGAGNVLLDQYWYQSLGGGFGPVGENFIKNATWMKLRQISIGYTLGPKAFQNIFLNSIDLTLTGRNLWLWTKDDLGFDPESNLTGSSNARGLQYFNSPTTKSILASIKINF